MVLSLFFSYIPGLNTWFAKQVEEIKKSIMLILLLIVAVAVFVLQCFSILDASLTCDKQGAVQLTWIFLSAVIANQSTYKITPQLKAVKAAKATLQLPKDPFESPF
jgi:membrane protein YdbS with pleckstrin-like domain